MCQWDVEADYLDDDYLTGLMPVLFSEEPAASEQALKDDPGLLMKGVESLQRGFFIPEHLALEEAHKLIKKPKAGDVDYAWRSRNLERLFDPAPRKAATPGTGNTKKNFRKFFLLAIL